MNFLVRHPDDPNSTARIFEDARRGLVVAVTNDASTVSFEEAGADPVNEVVPLLMGFGFIGPNDVAEAEEWSETPPWWRPSKMPNGVRRVLRLVEALRTIG